MMDEHTGEAGGEQTPSGLFGVFEPFGYNPKKPDMDAYRSLRYDAEWNAEMCTRMVLLGDHDSAAQYAARWKTVIGRMADMMAWINADNDRFIAEARP